MLEIKVINIFNKLIIAGGRAFSDKKIKEDFYEKLHGSDFKT